MYMLLQQQQYVCKHCVVFAALLRLLTQEKIDHSVALTLAFRSQCLVEEYSKYPLAYRDGHPVMAGGNACRVFDRVVEKTL
ncbi:hypothetical protein DPMN_036073 [Dreissena polymorpha]|uniref:Uncharacterized protein n=1 Tax=Dreissena polymorpha TaxID=45954 RepID=A0A9D4RNJ8_DREPO|nr:hypothetical protein DPMN_036073 [Dreissena polymorpha]